MKITDNNFVKELKRKNEDALEFVIASYGGLLKTVISRILINYPEDAEECLYDAILKIWENIGSYDEENPFKNWAAAVAKHTALDRLRKLKRLEPTVDVDELPLADNKGLTGDKLFDEFFMELISCLSESDKQLFIRIFWYGDSVDETSKALGLTTNNAYSRISRGKKRIIQHNPTIFAGGKNDE